MATNKTSDFYNNNRTMDKDVKEAMELKFENE